MYDPRYRRLLAETIYETLCWTWRPHGCRSSKRTDYLHRRFEEVVLRVVAEKLQKSYSYGHEVSIPTHGNGKFKVDIAATSDDASLVAFLLKLVGSSYNKNRFNYANTEKGETSRVLSRDAKKRKVSSVNILPVRLPRFGQTLKVETLNKYNMDYYYNEQLSPPLSGRAQGDVLYFKIAEDVLEAESRPEMLERLLNRGPSAITLVNYDAFMKGIEKIMS